MVRGKKTKAATAVKALKPQPIPTSKIGPSKMITTIVEAKNAATKTKKTKSAIASNPKLNRLTKKEFLDREAYEEKQGLNFRYVSRPSGRDVHTLPVTEENMHRMPKAYSMWIENPIDDQSDLVTHEYSFKEIVAMKSVFSIDANSISHVHHFAFVQLPNGRLKFSELNPDIQEQIRNMVKASATGYTFTRLQSGEDPTERQSTGDVLQSLVPSAALIKSILAGWTEGDLEVVYMPYPVNVYNLASTVQVNLMERYAKGEFDEDYPITAIHNYPPATSSAPPWVQAYSSWSTWFLLFFHSGMADKCKYPDGDLGIGWNAKIVQSVGLAWDQIFLLEISGLRPFLYVNYTVTTLSCSYIYTFFNDAAHTHLKSYDGGKDVYITERQRRQIVAINAPKDDVILPKFKAEIRKSEWGHMNPREPQKHLSKEQAALQSPADRERIDCYCGGSYSSKAPYHKTRHFKNSTDHTKIQCPRCKVVRLFYPHSLHKHRLDNHNSQHKKENTCENCDMTFGLKKGINGHVNCTGSQRPDYKPPTTMIFRAGSTVAPSVKTAKSVNRGKQNKRIKEATAHGPILALKLIKIGNPAMWQRASSPIAGPSFVPHVSQSKRRKRVLYSDDDDNEETIRNDDAYIKDVEIITLGDLPQHTALSLSKDGEVLILSDVNSDAVVDRTSSAPLISLDPLLKRYLTLQEITVSSLAPLKKVVTACDPNPDMVKPTELNIAAMVAAGLTCDSTVPLTMNDTENILSHEEY